MLMALQYMVRQAVPFSIALTAKVVGEIVGFSSGDIVAFREMNMLDGTVHVHVYSIDNAVVIRTA